MGDGMGGEGGRPGGYLPKVSTSSWVPKMAPSLGGDGTAWVEKGEECLGKTKGGMGFWLNPSHVRGERGGG